MPFTVVDFNNFWSPSGGGVRRYHLQKMAFYREASDVRLVFVMPDSKTFTEKVSESLLIEHVKAFRFPGKWEYRFIWKKSQIEPVLKKYMPDVIEVGSPYLLPSRVKKAAKKICPRAKLLGFWHADFPITYVERPITEKFGKCLGKLAKKIAFLYAKFEYAHFHGIEISSETIGARLLKNGFSTIHWIPLGCDVSLFSPEKRDKALVEKLRDGKETRPIIFFPHRFCNEKGLDLLLDAYPILAKELPEEPALILAGTGPLLSRVLEAEKKFKQIDYLGFIASNEEMAKLYASADIGLALSDWETFGLSILESMASGNAMVGASEGASGEHLRESNAGLLLSKRTPEELARTIIQLLENKEAYSIKARQYAEKFSWEACFTRQLSLYREISRA